MSKASVVVFGVLCALALVPRSEANRCLGRPDGFFINDFTACDAFFTCVRQTPVPGNCPPGFYFNDVGQMCDHPWNVICLLCTDDGGEDGSGFSDMDYGLQLSSSQFVPIENECRKYTFCTNGVGFLRVCGPGLMFDRNSLQCDLQQNVDCEENVCPNNINPHEATLVPDPRDCSSYYVCFQREPIGGGPRRCNEGLLFDPIDRRCDLAENVECEVIDEPPILTECPSTGLHYIPEQGSCDTYFICVEGNRIGPLQCAAGLIFDINTANCRPRSDEDARCITDPPAMFLKELLMGPRF